MLAERADESGIPKPVTAVTYSTAAVPPRTVIILGDTPTDEEVAAAIRDDLASTQAGQQTTFEI